MVLFSLTAVGSPSIYAELMYAAWPDNICFKSSSLPPRKAFRMAFLSPWLICFLLSAFFLNTSFSEFYHSRSTFIRPSITWQKKSLQCFVQRISRAYPGNFIVILNNFRLPRQEETINKNKQNKTQQKIDICIFVFVCLRPKLKEKCRDFFYLFFFTSLLHVPDAVFIRGRHLFWNCTYQGWEQGLIIWKILCRTCRYFFLAVM